MTAAVWTSLMGGLLGLLAQINWMFEHGPDLWPVRLVGGLVGGWLITWAVIWLCQLLGGRPFWPGWTNFRQRISSRRAVGLLAAGCLLFFYLASMGGHFYSFDSWFRFLTTKAIVDRGELIIDPIPGQLLPLYSKTGILQPLATIPLYLISKALPDDIDPPMDLKGPVKPDELMASTLHQFTTPLIALVFFALLLDWGYDRRVALAATMVFGLATITWPYARYHLAEPGMALCLIVALWQLLRFRLRRRARHLVWASTALALGAVNSTMFLVVPVPLASAYVVWLLWPRRGGFCQGWPQAMRWALCWAAPLAVAVAWVLWFNWFRYGAPFATGYEGDQGFPNFIYDGRPGFSLAAWVGIHGLLFSPGKSAFLYSPPLMAALLYLRGFFQRRRPEAVLTCALCLVWLLFYAKWWAWHGDISWGPRYLVPITCLAMLPLAQAFSLWEERGPLFKAVLLAVIVFGLVVQVLGVAVHFERQFAAIVGPNQKDMPLLHYIPHYSPVMGNYRMLVMGLKPDLYLMGKPLGLILAVCSLFCGGMAWLGAFTRRPGENS